MISIGPYRRVPLDSEVDWVGIPVPPGVPKQVRGIRRQMEAPDARGLSSRGIARS